MYACEENSLSLSPPLALLLSLSFTRLSALVDYRKSPSTMSLIDLDMHDDEAIASPATSNTAATQAANRRRKPLPVHRCRFPDWTPSAIAALTITPATFDAGLLGFGGASAERGVVGVGRANGDVELMLWGGHQGWVSWRVSLACQSESTYCSSVSSSCILCNFVDSVSLPARVFFKNADAPFVVPSG